MDPIKRPTRYKELADPQARPRYTGIPTFFRTPHTESLAEVVLAALENHTAALMANHGAIAYGNDMAGAVENMLLLEWACSVYWHAAALGKPRALGREQLEAVIEQFVSSGYGKPKERDS